MALSTATQSGSDSPAGRTITTMDGTRLYYKDWGRGQPVVFSHGWPLSAEAFEDQMFYLASRGFRCSLPLGSPVELEVILEVKGA